MGFARFMASLWGRLLRVVAGVAMLWVGFGVYGGTVGWVIAIVGVVVFLAGAFNFCIFGPLLGAPFRGKDLGAAA